MVRITRVTECPEGGATMVELSCGHTSERNQIYSYRVGARTQCFMCDQHALALKYDAGGYSHITGRA